LLVTIVFKKVSESLQPLNQCIDTLFYLPYSNQYASALGHRVNWYCHSNQNNALRGCQLMYKRFSQQLIRWLELEFKSATFKVTKGGRSSVEIRLSNNHEPLWPIPNNS